MLYKVKVGRDEYVGTPEEVVLWMAKADGAPKGGLKAYMRGIAKRVEALREREGDDRGRGTPVDVSSADAFLESLAEAGLLQMEDRAEASKERVRPSEAIGDGPVAYGKDVEVGEIDLDALDDSIRDPLSGPEDDEA
jgi:hypothetical protein